jgi:DNA-binding SARP family transcriptional activator
MQSALGGVLERETGGSDVPHPVLVCLLGGFRLLTNGQAVGVRAGSKMESLLAYLGLASVQGMPREVLLNRVWPNADLTLAGHSLNSLVHRLGALLGTALGGAAPVLQSSGYYRLNRDAGVAVDVSRFKELVLRGDVYERQVQPALAADLYSQAVHLYSGDLAGGEGAAVLLERDRLRAVHLGLLMRLSNYHFAQGDLSASLGYATELLAYDPCREDAHRMVMRCHVRRGERAQALRHYRTVHSILQAEFDVAPEPATDALLEQIRRDPASV